jgi:hypothetical protein
MNKDDGKKDAGGSNGFPSSSQIGEADEAAMKRIEGRSSWSTRVIRYQVIAFISLTAFIWLGEILDLPGLIWGSNTPVNWRESILETLVTVMVGTLSILFTRHLIGRIRSLEGCLPICARCKKIRDDQGTWHQLETYITERSGADFTHGLCPECMSELYPDIPRR